MLDAEGFFAYARERYRILLRRQGVVDRNWPERLPKSGRWTNDKILQDYRFCNVFREDDTVTKWIRFHLTHRVYGSRLLQAMIIARWFNRVSTLEKMLIHGKQDRDLFISWDSGVARHRLHKVKPLVTGAFIVKTPNGMNKLNGLIWCIEQILPDCEHLQQRMMGEEATLEGVNEVLKSYPFLGPFMAYEVVTDLRHTPLLNDAPDIMTWANPGPGAMRGAARVEGYDLRHFTKRSNANELQLLMQRLLGISTIDRYWPSDWPQWEMREVEHTLCEFDKYERVRLGQGTPKQRYDGALK